MPTYPAPVWIAHAEVNVDPAGGSVSQFRGQVPAGAVKGDLIVAEVTTQTVTMTSFPAGWTLQGSLPRGSGSHYILTKWVEDNEPLDPLFVLSGAQTNHACYIDVYRGVGAIGAYASTLLGASLASTTHAAAAAPYENSLVHYATWMLRAATGVQNWANATEIADTIYYGNSAYYNHSTAYKQFAAGATSAPAEVVTFSPNSGSGSNGVRASLVLYANAPVPRVVNRIESGQASTTLTQAVVQLPAGLQAGDIVVVDFSWVRSASTSTTVAYPGAPWIVCGSVIAASNSVGGWIAWAVYDPSMGSTITVTFGSSAAYGWQATAYGFRGGDPNKVLSTPAVSSLSNGTATALAALANVPDDSYILALGASFQAATTVTASWSTPIVKDVAANKTGGTSRVAHVVTGIDVQVNAGTYPSETLTWSASSAPRIAVLMAIPPLKALSGSFWPFF